MEAYQYFNNLNETSAYTSPTFDNSPLNRVLNIKGRELPGPQTIEICYI